MRLIYVTDKEIIRGLSEKTAHFIREISGRPKGDEHKLPLRIKKIIHVRKD